VSITVEHDKRKREILERALDVFVDEGYEDTTFQKIAERCGITRTILYLYFRNKREVFTFSIKLFLERLEEAITAIGEDSGLDQAAKLQGVVTMAVEQCGQNARLLAVILDYLGHLRASGGNADERVRRRTIRMRHILAGIMVAGQRSGEFRRFSVKSASDLLYSVIEAAIFRIAVLGRDDESGLAGSVSLFIQGLAAGPGQLPASAPPIQASAPKLAAAAASPGPAAPRAPALARAAKEKAVRAAGPKAATAKAQAAKDPTVKEPTAKARAAASPPAKAAATKAASATSRSAKAPAAPATPATGGSRSPAARSLPAERKGR
jgi:AcrR family transcriptional regulator